MFPSPFLQRRDDKSMNYMHRIHLYIIIYISFNKPEILLFSQ